jgi:hypothetical protein
MFLETKFFNFFRCAPVLFGVLCPFIGRAMCGLGFCRACSQFSYKEVTPAEIRSLITCVQALNLIISFTPLCSLYKEGGSVKASWTKRRSSSSRRPASGEAGPNRLFPESLRPRSTNRHRLRRWI